MTRQSTAKKRTHSAEEEAPNKATAVRNARPAAPRMAKNDPGSATELDRLIHERLRLGIVSALAVNSTLTFSELKRIMNTTDGNLSIHARKLEDAGYLSCVKSFDGRTPKTEYGLTATGRRALERYLAHMEALIRAARDNR